MRNCTLLLLFSCHPFFLSFLMTSSLLSPLSFPDFADQCYHLPMTCNRAWASTLHHLSSLACRFPFRRLATGCSSWAKKISTRPRWCMSLRLLLIASGSHLTSNTLFTIPLWCCDISPPMTSEMSICFTCVAPWVKRIVRH